ncbi:hypothetical protein DRO60_02630 [Candidatus Bathyarchaeota archaeon]|nr:MAG: hypothetical protein DRO60_02630 [Candidatus Bathyarchaeota archaeon]
MKVRAACLPCMVHRAYREVCYATQDEALRLKVMVEVAKLLAREFKPDAVPAIVGTFRDRLIKELTGNPDPYKAVKAMSNKTALELRPSVEEYIASARDGLERFRRACLCAAVGNAIEFDILGHRFSLDLLSELLRRAEDDVAIDDVSALYEVARKAEKVLYLTDNAGEVAFDVLLVREIKALGPEVIVAVKEEPCINDALMEDALAVGMDEVADELITTGTDTVGLVLEWASRECLRAYEGADLVVAKGMGNIETLTEYEHDKPIAFLLFTKCETIAGHLGVERGKCVVKLWWPRGI